MPCLTPGVNPAAVEWRARDLVRPSPDLDEQDDLRLPAAVVRRLGHSVPMLLQQLALSAGLRFALAALALLLGLHRLLNQVAALTLIVFRATRHGLLLLALYPLDRGTVQPDRCVTQLLFVAHATSANGCRARELTRRRSMPRAYSAGAALPHALSGKACPVSDVELSPLSPVSCNLQHVDGRARRGDPAHIRPSHGVAIPVRQIASRRAASV